MDINLCKCYFIYRQGNVISGHITSYHNIWNGRMDNINNLLVDVPIYVVLQYIYK